MIKNRLHYIRVNQRVSITELAALVDVPAYMVEMWDQWNKQIDTKYLSVLADYLQVSPEYLLGTSNVYMKTRLETWLSKKHINLKTLSAQTGISYSILSLFNKNEINLSYRDLKIIAKALKIDLHELFINCKPNSYFLTHLRLKDEIESN